jgi:GT2 family glycosyltransferase
VCDQFREKGLNIKYIFSGQRNLDGVIKSRVSGFALNIGIKQSTGDIIVLSCPEIYHLNNALDTIVRTLIPNPKSMVIPDLLYFDKTSEVTNYLVGLNNDQLKNPVIDTTKLVGGDYGRCHVEMNFLMAIYKNEIIEMGGFDEDFTGYAGEDNDFIERLKLKGLLHFRTPASAVHLYHGGHGDGNTHYENPAWVHNWNLLQSRRGTLIRNVGREWGRVNG